MKKILLALILVMSIGAVAVSCNPTPKPEAVEVEAVEEVAVEEVAVDSVAVEEVVEEVAVE